MLLACMPDQTPASASSVGTATAAGRSNDKSLGRAQSDPEPGE